MMMVQKRKQFDGLFAQLQDVQDGRGEHLNTVLFSKTGECSVIFEMENPVQQWCTDAEQYAAFQDVLANIVQTLGEGYAIQKQDVFSRQWYHHGTSLLTGIITFYTRTTVVRRNTGNGKDSSPDIIFVLKKTSRMSNAS